MIKLYFSKATDVISLILIVGFSVFFGMVNARKSNIEGWGKYVLVVFLVGLLMSMMSGMRDAMGTPIAIFPNNNWACILLSVLGGLAFVIGIISIFIRKQNFWQISFYMLSIIIIAKTALVEVYRIIKAI
jgi:isoprenylcysteine carboxyl methyltransferase (ICMT) family protein YpbQ